MFVVRGLLRRRQCVTVMSLVIHVWPGRWDLPSFDPACLAAIIYLQIAFPGHFSVAEEVNPDLSPCGL